MEAELTTLLTENGCIEEVVTVLANQGCAKMKPWLSWVGEASEVTSYLQTIDRANNNPVQRAALRFVSAKSQELSRYH